MRCLLAVHGNRKNATRDTIDSLLPMLNGIACDVVVAAPEKWTMGVLQLGVYTNKVPYQLQGFRLLNLLQQSVDSGRDYDFVILTDDRCLGMTTQSFLPAAKMWFEDHSCWLVGVQDEITRRVPFDHTIPFLAQHGMRYASWRPKLPPVMDGFVLLGKPAVQALFDATLLPPQDWQNWPSTCGDFLSLAVASMDGYQLGIGTTAQPQVPMFIAGFDDAYRRFVPPHLLREEFMIYHPVDRVYGYTEEQLRGGFKTRRVEQGG